MANLFSIIKKLRILPRWIIVILDLFIIACATLIGYLLRFNFELNQLISWDFQNGILASVLAGLAAILITKSYRGIVRYTGIQDGVRIVYTSLMAMAFLTVINWGHHVTYDKALMPYSVIIITFISSILALFYYRLVVKNIFTFYKNAISKSSNVAIFGAGQSGIVTKHVIDNDSNLRVAVFLEDDERKVGKIVDGTRIYNARKGIHKVLKEHNISELVISIKEISVERKNDIVDVCLKHHIKVRSVPPVEQWVKGELSIRQIKSVKIEDLLGRDTIKLDKENIKHDVLGKVVVITGAAGSIGSEIVRQVLRFGPKEVVMIDQAETALYELERELEQREGIVPLKYYIADVKNKKRLSRIFKKVSPSIVYHAAAYKHVPMMESNPVEAIETNVLGTRIVADLCVEMKVNKFVFISTDKAVNPTNVMGASKRIAEMYVQSLNHKLTSSGQLITSFVTTRFGNVLGSSGSVIPFFTKQISSGGPVTVTHPDITRYFMTIPEACQLVLEAGSMGQGGEIFIFDMGKAVKVVDLARKMIKLSGFEPGLDIDIVFTGLRDGEKLYEELLNTGENTIATYHNKIMIAKVSAPKHDLVVDCLEELRMSIKKDDEMALVTIMKNMVPEYKSNFSRFESLDRGKEGLEEAS